MRTSPVARLSNRATVDHRRFAAVRGQQLSGQFAPLGELGESRGVIIAVEAQLFQQWDADRVVGGPASRAQGWRNDADARVLVNRAHTDAKPIGQFVRCWTHAHPRARLLRERCGETCDGAS